MSQPPLLLRESGSGNDRTLLLLHGGGASSRMWERELRAFGEFHCLAPDLPGHGQSAHIQPFTLDTSVDGLASLIRERAAGGRVSLATVSLGVSVALALCERHPDLVERLFFSGPTPHLSRAAVAPMELVMRPLLRWAGPALRAKVAAQSMGLSAEQAEPMREDLERLNMTLVQQLNAVAAHQSGPVALRVPLLVTVGEREYGAVKKRAREIVRSSPGAIGYVVPGAGHAWVYEYPDLFDRVVRAWMNGDALPAQLLPL